jgi:hypothetical protein
MSEPMIPMPSPKALSQKRGFEGMARQGRLPAWISSPTAGHRFPPPIIQHAIWGDRWAGRMQSLGEDRSSASDAHCKVGNRTRDTVTQRSANGAKASAGEPPVRVRCFYPKRPFVVAVLAGR